MTARPVLLGVPWDASSSFLLGAGKAPPLIREALWSPSTNTATEAGPDIEPGTFDDLGDLALSVPPAEARRAIESAVAAVLDTGRIPVALGGDHSISYPALRAFRGRGLATVLHIDAHGDLYDEFPAFAPDGASTRLRPVPGHVDRYSHACPFARIMEDGLVGRLVQVGIRTATPHLKAQAARFGVDVYSARRWADTPVEALEGPLYVSLDLDGLDPACAPGVSHPEPGGLSTRDVVELLLRIRAPIAGADLVEYNPTLDTRDLTARVAAKLLKEILGVAIRNAR